MAPQAAEPTTHWPADLPEDTDPAELVRLAKIHWRIEHDYRELKTGLGLNHFEGPHLRRLAPSRYAGHRCPSVRDPAAHQPKSACRGLSLYTVLAELQTLHAT